MKWPRLVPQRACRTPVTLYLTDGQDEDGEPLVAATLELHCNYGEKLRQTFDGRHRVTLSEAVLLLDGDPAPDKALTGWAVLPDGQKRDIARGERPRNPDGTVNYTRLELL